MSRILDPRVPDAIHELVESSTDAWEAGAEPDALRILSEHPELRAYPLSIAELAYAEYSVRRQRGEAVLPSDFCIRFPTVCRVSLRRLLSAHHAMLDDGATWFRNLRQELIRSAASWPAPGEELLGFQIEEELGRGGLARVYLASELSAGRRRVVLKLTPYETGEGHLQSNLVHESVVPVLTVRQMEDTGWTAIVMPYWGRATLQDVRNAWHGGGPRSVPAPDLIPTVARDRCGTYLPVVPQDRAAVPSSATYGESVARVAVEIASALAYMHDQGVLHRDLKPTNILLTPGGRPLLMDFNLSATFERGEVLLGGTVPYMPPELLRSLLAEASDDEVNPADPAAFGHAIPRDELPTVRGFLVEQRASSSALARRTPSADADPRSDLFSLGVILFELLCGRLPFGAPPAHWPLRDQAAWMLQQQTSTSPWTAPDVRRLPTAWQEILRRCLAPSNDGRYSDAHQLEDALAAILPSAEPAAGRRRTSSRHFWSNCLAAISTTACVALVVLGLTSAPPQFAPAPTQATPAVGTAHHANRSLLVTPDAPFTTSLAQQDASGATTRTPPSRQPDGLVAPQLPRASPADPSRARKPLSEMTSEEIAAQPFPERALPFPSRWSPEFSVRSAELYDAPVAETLRRLDNLMKPLRDRRALKGDVRRVQLELEQFVSTSGPCRADALACQAYCETYFENHRLANNTYALALRQMDSFRYVDPARLYNSYGHSLLQAGNLDEAIQMFSLAIAFPSDDELRAAAFANRAFATLRRVNRDLRNRPSAGPAAQSLLYDMLQDVEGARQAGAESARFHLYAGVMYAVAAHYLDNQLLVHQSTCDLVDALNLGYDPWSLRNWGPAVEKVVAATPLLSALVPPGPPRAVPLARGGRPPLPAVRHLAGN